MDNLEDISYRSEADEIITPEEYLKRQLEQEAEARDVLPGTFTECTFNLGPLNQPIYVCLTCKNDPSLKEKGPASICYSCSISCHTDHELIELFNKRDSICECGTKKFPFKCTLEQGVKIIPKDSSVEHPVDSDGWRKTILSNRYTHNHEGLYCWCNMAYDPEIEEDIMVQCLDCQDWFHQRCIGDYTPEDDIDFICSTCVQKHPALFSYLGKGNLSAISRLQKTTLDIPSNPSNNNENEQEVNVTDSPNKLKRPREDEILPHSSKPRLEAGGESSCGILSSEKTLTCKKPDGPSKLPDHEFSIVAKKDWRDELCRCNKCLDLYHDQEMIHLIDIEEVYTPEEDLNRDLSIHDAGLQAMASLPHDRAIKLANQVDSFRSKLKEFLEPFAKSGKVITKEDIQKHFNPDKRNT